MPFRSLALALTAFTSLAAPARGQTYASPTFSNVTVLSAPIGANNVVRLGDLTATLSAYATKASLAAVATSGAYADLLGRPTIPAAAVAGTTAGTFAAGNDTRIVGAAQTSSLASGAYAAAAVVGTTSGTVAAGNDTRIVGAAQASSLATVATSGSYPDLLNKPTIPVAGTTAGTYAAGNDTRITGAYPASNPSAYITAAGAPVQSVAGLAGTPTAAQLQTALSLASGAYAAAPTAGTAAGTFAAGNDARITGAYAASNPSGYVTAAGAASAAPVQSVAGLAGTPTAAQIQTALGLGTAAYTAALAAGTTSGTYAAGNDTRITGALAATTAATTYAPLASPPLTGTPTAPTAAAGTSTTQVATTGFAQALATATGTGATTRSRTGTACLSNGTFAAAGDAQTCVALMRVATTSTAAARLTTDGAAAGAANCINIPSNSAYRLRIDLVGFDTTAPTTNLAQARWDDLILLRGAAASTTGLAGTGAATQQGNGTMSGTAVLYGLGGDTTNGCLILQVTPVNANSTHWVARITTVEVQ